MTTTSQPRLARCEDCGFQSETTDTYPRPGGFEIVLCQPCRTLPPDEGHRCQAPDAAHQGAVIPAEILAMLQDGWELEIDWLPQTRIRGGHYYAEITRWGMAKTGSQRKRIWWSGAGDSPAQALLEAARRLRESGDIGRQP